MQARAASQPPNFLLLYRFCHFFLVGSQLKKRTVQHFGYEFRYGTNDVDYCAPLSNKIPEYITPIVSKMLSVGAIPGEPDQLTVNQYSPGQGSYICYIRCFSPLVHFFVYFFGNLRSEGIPPHCDTHSCFEGPIVSLSLGSDIVMDFRQGETICSIVLPARSLLVMDGASRLV